MTVKEARDAGLIELTVPSDPNERIETQWGELSIQLWLTYESVRIKGGSSFLDHQSGTRRRTEFVHHDNGYLSLWVNKVSKGAQLEAVE